MTLDTTFFFIGYALGAVHVLVLIWLQKPRPHHPNHTIKTPYNQS